MLVVRQELNYSSPVWILPVPGPTACRWPQGRYVAEFVVDVWAGENRLHSHFDDVLLHWLFMIHSIHTPRFRTTSTGWIISVLTVTGTSWCCNLARLCLQLTQVTTFCQRLAAVDKRHTTSRNQLCSEICADECRLCCVDSSTSCGSTAYTRV